MTTKTLITFCLFFMLVLPTAHCIAQKVEGDPTETEMTQSEPDTLSSKEIKAEKKKNKNVVMIDDKFFISLGINLATMILIITLIYYPNDKKMDYIFTFVIFNLIIFLLTFVLKYVKLSMGSVFGMFAVFSMLRYRTAGLSVRDMTYLFIFIAIGLMSAIQLDYYKLIIIHAIILSAAFLLDGKFFFKKERCKRIQYEKIDLIKPEKKEELMTDLSNRTGLKIHRIILGRINFLKDTASIKVYYYD